MSELSLGSKQRILVYSWLFLNIWQELGEYVYSCYQMEPSRITLAKHTCQCSISVTVPGISDFDLVHV